MPKRWLLKTEPSAYSFDRLVSEGGARWDGVTNPVALKHLRAMERGDTVVIYHTGGEKAAVGLATAAGAPYADPADAALTVVDIRAGRRLAVPVTLAAIKADRAFTDCPLVRIPRLSVVPLTEAQWMRLLELGGQR